MTDNRTGDATMLPEQLLQISETEELAPVATDGAYETRLCYVERLRSEGLLPSCLRVETANSGNGIHRAFRLAMSRYAL